MNMFKNLLLICSILFLYDFSYSQIEQFWINRYTSSGKNVDVGKIVKLDTDGNVFVGGTANGKFVVIKYNADGVLQWEQTSSAIDTLVDIEIYANGQDIIVGGTYVSSSGTDFAILRLSNSDGSVVWSKTYSAGGNEYATAMTMDGDGMAYLAGHRLIGAAQLKNIDMLIVKFDCDSGDTVYSKKFSGAGSFEDYVRVIEFSQTDNSIVITGENYEASQNFNYFTTKFSTNGDSVWSSTYNNNNSSTSSDIPRAMAIDGSGNVIVTGTRIGTIEDYLTIKYNSSGVKQWEKSYTGTRTDYPRTIITNSSGDIFVSGASYVTSEHDVVTIKYNSSGTQQWINTYNGTGNGKDEVSGSIIDFYGNILVIGNETGQVDGISSSIDGLLLMIDKSGNLRKAKTYTGLQIADTVSPFPGNFSSITVDRNTGAVYVVGSDSSIANSTDIIVIRYESRNAINGYVKRDADGDASSTGDQIALAGSRIVLEQSEIVVQSTVTDIKGNFSFPLVDDGEYILKNLSPDESDVAWDPLQAIAGTGGNTQVVVSDNSISLYVQESQTSTNNGFIIYNQEDGAKYRTMISSDYQLKKGRKIYDKKKGFLLFPNSANLRDTIFAHEFPKKTTKKFIVGVVDSPATSWWVYLPKVTDIQKVYPHNQKAKWFILYGGKDVVGDAKKSEKKSLTVTKHNNHLAQEQVTLKMNLIASKNLIFPSGLENIIYDDGNTANYLNGFTIGEIANITDSLLTFRGKALASMNSDVVYASTVDSVITRINRAFRVAMPSSDSTNDTTSFFVNGLRMSGAISISSVSYLRYNPNASGKSEISFASADIPNEFTLYQNYPNPFNPKSIISFQLPKIANVNLKVYDILGRKVATLFENERMESGTYDIEFDGSSFSSGIYFYKLSADNFSEMKKMILIK